MISKVLSIILSLVAVFVISSEAKLTLPPNFTWPLSATNERKYCFAGRFTLTLNVNYTKTDGSFETVEIPLNDTTYQTYSASCHAPSYVHQLTVSMLNSFTAIIFQFTVDEKDTTSLTKVYGYITVDDQQQYIKNYSPDVAGLHKFSSSVALFSAGRAYSYRCNTKTQIKDFVTNSTHFGIVSVDVVNLRIQPFVNDTNPFNDYNDEVVCQADIDKESNLIPIIVGACLALLVVVVLVAYLIGRRRSRPGYQNV